MNIVVLEENPSTGYRWYFNMHPIDNSLLSIIEDIYIHHGPTRTADGEYLVGGGGHRVLFFRGQGKVRGVYARGWKGGDVADACMIGIAGKLQDQIDDNQGWVGEEGNA